jgi:hypothetical protein
LDVDDLCIATNNPDERVKENTTTAAAAQQPGFCCCKFPCICPEPVLANDASHFTRQDRTGLIHQ